MTRKQDEVVQAEEASSPKIDTRFYGRRKGRPIVGYRAGLMQDVLPQIALPLESEGPLDLEGVFSPLKSYALEIGFGGGEHLAERALQKPHMGFIGAEAFVNGVASMVRHVYEKDLQNVRIHHGDVRVLLPRIPDQSLDELYVLFPDPWPKKRHHERRLIQYEVLGQFERVLKLGGRWYFATDHSDYLNWSCHHIEAMPTFEKITETNERPEGWPPTRYEAKATAAGRSSTYFIFERTV